ncbi:unnamed protein product [Rhizophagus irregularis]|nr:unnamed protein product [Rhizophagus irregularis]
MQEVQKGRVSPFGTERVSLAISERVSFLGTAISERVSSLGMAISVISKNVKDAERTVSSFGIVIGNRGYY